MFSNKYRYGFIATLGVYSWASSLFIETFDFYHVQINKYLVVVVFLMICLLVWEGNRYLNILLSRYSFYQQGTFRPLMASFGLSLIVALAASVVTYFGFGFILLGRLFVVTAIELKLVVLYALRVNLFLQCLHGMHFFFGRFRQKKLETESLKRVNMQAKLQAITSQVNPHFLFNNLNVLSALVMQKNNDANRFIEAFSTVYRYILQSRDSEIVTLKVELEFIEPYIFMLKARFGSALDIQLSITGEHERAFIVPMALQLLIENATKHNIVSARFPLVIRIFVRENLHLVVENNYQPKNERPISTRIGLENIDQRYNLLSGKHIMVEKTESTFTVSIPLLDPISLKH